MKKTYQVIKFCCDFCGEELQSEEGYAVCGNVHVFNTEEYDGAGGGLIGNNFDDYGALSRTQHFCFDCMFKALDFST